MIIKKKYLYTSFYLIEFYSKIKQNRIFGLNINNNPFGI